ncbi:MAG: PAS domain-containing protein [Roseiarcus sp.]
MKLAASRQLYAYWNELRRARSAPERNDVDPGAIRGILADTFIVEFDALHVFPMRVVGTRTNALFLRELRGTPFLELWREEDRDEMRAILANVADEAQPFLIGAAARPLGFAPIDVEILLLPLRHHGDTHSRILGCCAPNASPHWLGLIGVESMALLTLRALDPRERADAPPPGPAGSQGFGRAPSLPRRGHLFHYSSNR